MTPTSDSVIRYFYPEDAQAAERLAALLSDGGPDLPRAGRERPPRPRQAGDAGRVDRPLAVGGFSRW